MEVIIMINRTELEHFVTENNISITIEKLLSEYRSKIEISVFVRPWVAKPLKEKNLKP